MKAQEAVPELRILINQAKYSIKSLLVQQHYNVDLPAAWYLSAKSSQLG